VADGPQPLLLLGIGGMLTAGASAAALAQADASEQLGTLLPRERHKQAYGKALVDKYKHMPEIKRIMRHRHLPTAIYKVCAGTGGRCWALAAAAAAADRAAAGAAGGLRAESSGLGSPAGGCCCASLCRACAACPGPAPCAAARPPQAAKLRRTIIDNDKRKLDRRIAHSAPGSIKIKPERKKKIITELE
jgi:hypothetical protein